MAFSGVVYLGAHRDIETARRTLRPENLLTTINAYISTTIAAWEHGQPCVSGLAEPLRELVDPVRRTTDAFSEAIRITVAHAFVVGDLGGAEAARRTYGCLYGLERDGDNTVPIVPGIMSDMARIQRLTSAVLIFLFALALRNTLRLK